MDFPCTVRASYRFVTPPGWDWSTGATPPTEEILAWPTGAAPSPELTARVEQLAAWTRAFVGKHRGIELATLTIADVGDPPAIVVLLVRDDIDDAADETSVARRAGKALARERPELAARVTFRGEYCK